jgi:hypothetical protein
VGACLSRPIVSVFSHGAAPVAASDSGSAETVPSCAVQHVRAIRTKRGQVTSPTAQVPVNDELHAWRSPLLIEDVGGMVSMVSEIGWRRDEAERCDQIQ